MSFYYIIALLCSLILAITAVARINDMGRVTHSDWHWWVRRVGMLAVVASGSLFVLSPFYYHEVDGVETLMLLGVTLSWVTTPSQPPWWKYITRGDTVNSGRRKEDRSAAHEQR